MEKHALCTSVVAVLAIASVAIATNNIQSVYVKPASSLVYRNSLLYPAVSQLPAINPYDAHLNALKYGYVPPAPMQVYAVLPNHAVPQQTPGYVPQHALTTASVPTAPSPVTYISPNLLAQLQNHPGLFISRYFPSPHYH